ncbi:unnamed protein product, partial [Timema podura]|nr:unnamed protein product [Timema podura]
CRQFGSKVVYCRSPCHGGNCTTDDKGRGSSDCESDKCVPKCSLHLGETDFCSCDKSLLVATESEKPTRKNYPQYTRLGLNHDLPIIGSLVSCEGSALDHVATKTDRARYQGTIRLANLTAVRDIFRRSTRSLQIFLEKQHVKLKCNPLHYIALNSPK